MRLLDNLKLFFIKKPVRITYATDISFCLCALTYLCIIFFPLQIRESTQEDQEGSFRERHRRRMSLPVSSRAQLQEIAATATAAATLANANAASSGGKGVPLSQLMKPETEGSSKRSGKSPQRIATAKAPQASAIKEEKNTATAGEEGDELAGGRDRRGSYSSTSDRSSYSGSSSEGEDECYRKSPRLKAQRTSKGFTDFAIRDLELAEFGRREIEYAEQGWCYTKEGFWIELNVDPFVLFQEWLASCHCETVPSARRRFH